MLSILMTKGSPWLKGNLIKVTHAEPCNVAQRVGVNTRTHTHLPMDKHLNSNVRAIKHCQCARAKEFSSMEIQQAIC